jgi:hypothetical protein
VQQIIITDAPAVLGLARFTKLDERYAFAAITAALRAASVAGQLRAEDPETLARLLLGALTRGGMLIANSPETTANPRRRRHSHPRPAHRPLQARRVILTARRSVSQAD